MDGGTAAAEQEAVRQAREARSGREGVLSEDRDHDDSEETAEKVARKKADRIGEP